MRKSDIICPECGAGYRRLELVSKKGTAGEFRCRGCNHVLEVFDGSCEVAIRLTVQPEKYSSEAPRPDLKNSLPGQREDACGVCAIIPDRYEYDQRQGLERPLAQARRIAAQPLDDTIRERLRRFIKELEEALKGN